MQPSGNMPGAAQPASPVRPVAPVGPTKPVNPAAPVKPAAPAGGPTFDNGPSVVDGKGSKKTGWILAVVFLLIVAAGGVGFGVWAMMDGNVQKDALNEQISALKQQNSELQNKSGGSDIDADADNNGINTADYIYLEDWNIKLKIGSELELFNLTHYDGQNGDIYAMIVAYPNQFGEISDKYGAAIDNGDSFPTNFITRSKDATYNPLGFSDPEYVLEPIYNDGEYNYFVYRSSGAILVNMENEADGIIEAAGDMAEILNNVENYSKI